MWPWKELLFSKSQNSEYFLWVSSFSWRASQVVEEHLFPGVLEKTTPVYPTFSSLVFPHPVITPPLPCSSLPLPSLLWGAMGQSLPSSPCCPFSRTSSWASLGPWTSRSKTGRTQEAVWRVGAFVKLDSFGPGILRQFLKWWWRLMLWTSAALKNVSLFKISFKLSHFGISVVYLICDLEGFADSDIFIYLSTWLCWHNPWVVASPSILNVATWSNSFARRKYRPNIWKVSIQQ